MHDANFPYDVQWTDIEAMSYHLDFTYDYVRFHGLPELVRELQSQGKHYVNIIDPGISSTRKAGSYPPFDDGLKQGIFINKSDSNEPIIGRVKHIYLLLISSILLLKVWPGLTAFPDFTNPNSVEWWTNIAAAFHEIIPFDGMWLVLFLIFFFYRSQFSS